MTPPAADPRVTRALDHAAELIHGSPLDGDVEALLAELDALSGRELLRFEKRARHLNSGIYMGDIAGARRFWRRAPSRRLGTVMGLVSSDGFDRQRAIERAELRPCTIALIGARATDWVPQVRRAAVERLSDLSAHALLAMLPLFDAVARERPRGREVDELIERRLTDDDLRVATHSADADARRAGWRRLIGRGAYEPAELSDRAIHDRDVLVRNEAATQLEALDEPNRRLLASTMLKDPVGWLAAQGLKTMVDLDGEPAILAALTARTATLRRRARQWATIRGVDARSVYLDRLERQPNDALAVIALAEIGDRSDHRLLVEALLDERAPVRAAALKAMAQIDRAVAKRTALEAIASDGSGRVRRAAAAVLRKAALSAADLDLLEAVVLGAARHMPERLRALGLIRRSRWRHLASLLQLRRMVDRRSRDRIDELIQTWVKESANISLGPGDAHRRVIEEGLPELAEPIQRSIGFVLRTAS